MKIIRDIEHPPLYLNKDLYAIVKSLPERNISNLYNCGYCALSFTKILNGLLYMPLTTGSGNFLVLVSKESWVDISNDQAALRRYDAAAYAANEEHKGITILTGGPGKGIIVPSYDLPKDTAYAFTLKEYVLGKETTRVIVDGIEIVTTKDFSSIKLEPVDFIKFTDIVPYT